jgi:hypothetical protein
MQGGGGAHFHDPTDKIRIHFKLPKQQPLIVPSVDKDLRPAARQRQPPTRGQARGTRLHAKQ